MNLGKCVWNRSFSKWFGLGQIANTEKALKCYKRENLNKKFEQQSICRRAVSLDSSVTRHCTSVYTVTKTAVNFTWYHLRM